MYNFFFIIIFSLFLCSCYEEEEKQDKHEVQTIKDNSETATNQNISFEGKNENLQKPNQEVILNNLESSNENSIIPTSPENGSIQEKKEIQQSANNDNIVVNLSIVSFKVDKNDIVLGDKNAEVVVIEYFSPTCPHCSYYHSAIFPEIKQKYIDTNKIAYVIREFIATKQDLDAAILERCKGDMESFLQFQKIILEQQDKWAYSNKYRELLTDIGQLGGITPENYKECLSNNKITEILLNNTNFITKAPKFVGTPAFFINGVQLEQGYNATNISLTIDKAIEEKNKAANTEVDI